MKQHSTDNTEGTDNTRAINGPIKMKRKLYLQITLLVNYIVEKKNLFAYVEKKKSVCLCRVVFCKACSFEVFCQKKMSQKRDLYLDKVISLVQVLSVLYPKVHVLHYADSA